MFARVKAALAAAAMAAFALASQPAAAAVGEDVFAVPRVPVQAQAQTATAAKSIAQAQGRRRAADILLRRLTVEADWAYLPRLAAGEPAAATAGARIPISLTDRDLENLESGFEVYSERSSATTYRALITYRFKPDAVRRLLQNARLPYSETQMRRALVLPVLQTDNGLYLWESNNPWMAAWKSRPLVNELTPMTAPLGDLEDSALITARQALALEPAPLEAIAHHYSVSQVIVAHARLRQSGGSDQLSVRLINAFREGPGAVGEDVFGAEFEDDADAYSYESPGAQTVIDDLAAKVGDVLSESAASEPTGNFAALSERAIEAAIAKYAGGWKARTLIDHSTQALLDVSVFFQTVDEWMRIRAGLGATPLVNSVQVFALSPRGAELRLKVFGDPQRLAVAMENHGVVFWSEDGRRWILATTAIASQLRGSRFLRERRAADLDGVFNEPRIESASDRIEPNETAAPKIDQRY